MAKTILKKKDGKAIDLDGATIIVKNSAGADAPLNDELAALRASISGLMAASGALVFKGLVDAQKHLPASGYNAGWTYKVAAAGIYAGETCEIGDMIVCVNTAGDSPSDADWQVIQTNIDGAVTGPASAAANNLAAFENATGKVVKDSGIKLADAADAVAKKHDHANASVINSLAEGADGALTYKGARIESLDCVVINQGDPVPANLRDHGIIFEIQNA